MLDTGAALALISVGADNDYGHPAPETLALLDRLGAISSTAPTRTARSRSSSEPASSPWSPSADPPRVAGKVASTRRSEPDLPANRGGRVTGFAPSVTHGMLTAPWPSKRRPILGTTTLITGADEFLAERTIDELRDGRQGADADADITELAAAELGAGALAEISSPSLFASMRCVVVRTSRGAARRRASTGWSTTSARRPPTSRCVLHHTGGMKGKAVLDKLRKAGADEVKAGRSKKWELPGWVVTEFRRHPRPDRRGRSGGPGRRGG